MSRVQRDLAVNSLELKKKDFPIFLVINFICCSSVCSGRSGGNRSSQMQPPLDVRISL